MSESCLVKFEVRNDSDRGILVLTISLQENLDNEHFFQFHHQPINQHPEQIQGIIRQAKPSIRTKSVNVDISAFSALYWNMPGKFFEFKGTKLNSTENQILKLQQSKINKEVGAIKRKKTVEASTKNKKQTIREKLQKDEEKFQLERAKRVKEAMGIMMETDGGNQTEGHDN